MRHLRRTVACSALSLLVLQAVVPAAPPSFSTEAQLPVPLPRIPAASTARLVAALRLKIPIEPVALNGDPYLRWHDGEPPSVPAGTVCGVRFEADHVHYRLSKFADAPAARAAGFAVTHYGACGTCSTLRDLAVYLEKPDLTSPVRRCAIKWTVSARLKCLQELGFTDACAQTWLYDVQNTRQHCLRVCILSWIESESPTGSDGRLNGCLQCDEDRSGPIFKATAGRTRRNSGIRSSIPRPASEIAPVVHDYVPE